jgi:Secretion system C-terminal sorting domain/Viral BACON domain
LLFEENQIIISQDMKNIFIFSLMISVVSSSDFLSGQTTVYHPTFVKQAVYTDVTPPLREMKLIQIRKEKNALDKEVPNKIGMKEFNDRVTQPFLLQEDPVWQKQDGTYLPSNSAPIQNFEGIGNLSGVYPPDTQGDVGPDKYIQVVNMNFAVYSKTGTIILGPAAISTIFAGIPPPWNGTNSGDPVVLYDQAASRWIISEFSLPSGNYAELVAISQTSDPTGAWYRYVFQFGNNMPDYPKFGIWPDGYYLSVNQFVGGYSWGGVGACALERAKMLTGDVTAQMVYFDLGASGDPESMLPSDWDGTTPPNANEPNYFTYFNDWSSTTEDYLKIWQFQVDWTTTANSTFSEAYSLVTSPFDSQLCGATRGRCIPQPGTSIKLESLSDRLMYRLQYRNFGSYRAMVTNHTVDVDGTGLGGIRWYELRNTGSAWTIYQQGTYSPDASTRWMGSVAMNTNGDIALGYSVSNSTSVYPSIRYTGRRANDPLGQMTVAEQTIMDGTGNQTGSACRWGDYSGMSVDPADDQTFWFTTEYIQNSGIANWQTRIASFKFSNNPSVTTLPATAVTGSSATLNGNINPNGLASTYHFEWGTTISYGNSTTTTSAGSGTSNVAVSANISSLITGTPYHYRIVGVNSDGTTNGNDMTLIPGGAGVTTTAASGITMISATSGGNVIYDGGSSVTTRGVCWSTTANPTITGNHTTDGSGLGVFTSSITGLSANTTYHIRAYATNGNGTFYGDDLTFTTLCGVYNLPFSENFTTTGIPGCWSQVDHQGNGQIWQFGVITGESPNPALNGNYAYLNSDAYGSGNSQNADLVSPLLDLSGYSTVNLQFNHYFKAYSGSSGSLSYSIDGGTTWTLIQSYTTTSPTNPATFDQAVNAVAGQAQVKFKWNYTGTYGWYWAIDDIAITGTSSVVLIVVPSNQNVTPPAGTTNFTVTSSASWNAISDATSWCTVTPSGTGNGTIIATYSENTSVNQRVAHITVSASGAPTQTVTVTQSGIALILNVVPANQNVTSPAGATAFTVTSNAGWTVTSDMSWCVPTPSGTGNGTINATYTENTTVYPRIATLTVTVSGFPPITVTVTQAGATPILTVIPANQDVPADAGAFNFTVTSNTDWTVSCNVTWCNVTVYGSGNGPLTAIYEENLSVTPRVATITVTISNLSPVTVTLTQSGAAQILAVQPANQDVPAEAGTTSFTVTSNADWTTSSDVTWCTATPLGSGNGTITANYDLNETNNQRMATIQVTISGLTPIPVTVTQDASTVSVGELTTDRIRIYPNPTKGIFNIAPSEGDKISMNITVQDLTGKSIMEKTFKGRKEYQLDLSTYPDGTYHIIINTVNGMMVQKLVIRK